MLPILVCLDRARRDVLIHGDCTLGAMRNSWISGVSGSRALDTGHRHPLIIRCTLGEYTGGRFIGNWRVSQAVCGTCHMMVREVNK